MKSAFLVLSLFTWLAINNLLPDGQPLRTRASTLSEEVDRVYHLLKALNFDASKGQIDYEMACSIIGVELKWMPKNDSLWGMAWCEKIEMYLPRDHKQTPCTFFHEIGHVVMKHCRSKQYLTEDQEEGEATAFSAGMLDRLNLPIYDHRAAHYSNRTE